MATMRPLVVLAALAALVLGGCGSVARGGAGADPSGGTSQGDAPSDAPSGATASPCVDVVTFGGARWLGVRANVTRGRSLGQGEARACPSPGGVRPMYVRLIDLAAVRGIDAGEAMTLDSGGASVVYLPLDEENRVVLSAAVRALLPDDVLPGCEAARPCRVLGDERG